MSDVLSLVSWIIQLHTYTRLIHAISSCIHINNLKFYAQCIVRMIPLILEDELLMIEVLLDTIHFPS